MRRPVRCLIFDYGCVISKPQETGILNTLCEYFSSDLPSFNKSYRAYRNQFDSGLISSEQYWDLVARSLDRKVTLEQIKYINDLDVRSWVRIDQAMLSFISGIRDSVSEMAVLSNMTFDTLTYIKAEYTWIGIFDKHFFSCEIGMSKPDPGIYTHCLNELDTDPDQCLFIDDSEENVIAAGKHGINCLLYSGFPAFQQEITSSYKLARRI